LLRDPDRMARFQREAEVLASLDHPNIGHIYGIVDSADSRGLVRSSATGYAVTAEGQRFLIYSDQAVETDSPIIVVQNWWAALRK
jgi:serine/threonine-protein kinase